MTKVEKRQSAEAGAQGAQTFWPIIINISFQQKKRILKIGLKLTKLEANNSSANNTVAKVQVVVSLMLWNSKFWG